MKRLLPLAAVIAISLFGLAAMVLLGSSRHGPDVATVDARPGPPAAGDGTAAGAQAPQPLSYVGVVVARDSVEVAARVDGWVTNVKVGLGDRVEHGAVLATLDDRPLREELTMAQAALRAASAEADRSALELEEARERHARRRRTVNSNVNAVSEEELATARFQEQYAVPRMAAARARVAEQQARISQLEQRIADTVARAPFDAVVTARYVSPGATVIRGTPLVRLVNAGDLWVRFAVPEADGARLRGGVKVSVRVDDLAALLGGMVEKISPEVDGASSMIVAEARLVVPPALGVTALSGRSAHVALLDAAASRAP